MTEITDDERAIYDKITRLSDSLRKSSFKLTGLNRDPKMFSVMLFRRLWSNHRGYTLLHNNELLLEAEIVLRSGIEAAICIAANYSLREDFVELMRRDAAKTVLGQIKTHRQDGGDDLIKDQEAFVREVRDSLPQGENLARLNWKKLAENGQVPQLYGFHRRLSGVSAHVTGLSIMSGISAADGSGSEQQEELTKLSKRSHLMMMAGATLLGSSLHAAMIEDQTQIQLAEELKNEMNEISYSWL
ncbi:MAG: hypothetical protein HKN36_10305 [Hellea sp.]|nr:hypothetical protein [Hellea sp.]